jgi:hypothetical protein
MPMNIFGKKEKDEVRVPEIEVHGDEVRVDRPDGQEQVQDPASQTQDNRNYRLPKTKWF